ncbi:MAG: hypothetical protein QM682_06815 [Paracoccus sp. (in: a-proteobacteria)]|uniref:PepSY domain-containing protein n=1 Tax=Paracoccus sp. TaxID=267 RepID=UPI0039E366A4
MRRPLPPLAPWLALALLPALGLWSGGHAQVHGDTQPDPLPENFQDFQALDEPGHRIVPLREAVRIAHARFRGRLIAARLKPARPAERARGIDLVHELRLLTPRRDVLLIRLDARSGAFLEVAGSGLAEARVRNGDSE